MTQTRFETFNEARSRLKNVLDAAEAQLPVHIHRGDHQFLVVAEDLFRRALTQPVPAPQIFEENGGWSIVLPGVPVGSDSTDFDEAVDDFIAALSEYAEDWIDDPELRGAPSHRHNAVLVALVDSLSPESLRNWVVGSLGADLDIDSTVLGG